MKRKLLNTVPSVIVFFLLIVSGSVSGSTQKTNHEILMNPELKRYVDATFSVNARERAEAAYRLGLLGEKAGKATPFLMRLLEDNIVTWCMYNGSGMWTTPGREASAAIAKIGSQAYSYLFMLLKGSHPYVFIGEGMENNLRSALAELTGKDHEFDFQKWAEEIRGKVTLD